MSETIETELWVNVVNGVVQTPRMLDCPECRAVIRRRPGNRYVCADCGSETTLDLTPLERRINGKKV